MIVRTCTVKYIEVKEVEFNTNDTVTLKFNNGTTKEIEVAAITLIRNQE